MKLPDIRSRSALAIFILAGVSCACAARGLGATTNPTFVDRYDYGGCSGSYANLAAADINGDGVPDLICGDYNSLLTLLGNGDGTFRPGPSSSIGFLVANELVVQDVNGDGKPDLIAASVSGLSGPFGVAVAFGNGDGTFQPAIFYQTGTATSVFFLVIGDFNRDGIADIVAQSDEGIWFFAGAIGGSFQPGALTPVGKSNGYPHPVVAADVNRDAKLDIVVFSDIGFATLLGNGDGTFQPELDTVVSILETAFAVGDLNGDGRPDVVVVGDYYSDGLLYFGNGDGTFTLSKQVYIDSTPFWVAVADVNGEGFADIISGGSDIVFGNGKGQFSQPVYYPISSYGDAPYLLPFDLRNNGRTDLVFLNYYGGLSVLLNEGKGKFQDGESVPVSGGGAFCAVSADFNGDGKPDLAVGVSDGISILLGTGKASAPYTQGELLSYSGYSCPVEGDLNGDGIVDLLATTGAGTAVAFLGKGDGTFTQVAQTTPLSSNGVLVLGDFNGDGKLDFALNSNLLAYGNGDGTFQTPKPFIPNVMSTSIVGIAAAKLNGDRETDIVLTDFVANLVYVLLSDGKKGFTQTTISTVGNCYAPYAPALADVNADGKKDLVLGCSGGTAIYLNNGAGALTYSGLTLSGGGSFAPLVTDVNGDGLVDITIESGSDLNIVLGDGSVTYTPSVSIGTGSSPGQALAVNAHGQSAGSGKPDLIVPDASGVVNVYLNTTK